MGNTMIKNAENRLRTLIINMTKNCNLSCSFCSADPIMSDSSIKQRSDLDLVVQEILENKEGKYLKYDRFAITGGEPFINLPLLERIIEVILNYDENASILINTNGTYLTPSIIKYLNGFPNIRLNISLDGLFNSERDLFTSLLSNWRNGYETLSAIKLAENIEINNVLPLEKILSFEFAMELDLIQSYFPKAIIKCSIDHTTKNLNNFSIDDAWKFQRLIMRLEELGIRKRIIFTKFNFQTGFSCDGRYEHQLMWNGEFDNACTRPGIQGCGRFYEQMKPGMYDLMMRIVSGVEEHKLLESPPDYPNWNYRTDIGYVGKRWDHTAKFKHSNFKYKNKAMEIAIKEVN